MLSAVTTEVLDAFVNCSITKGISQHNFRENVIWSRITGKAMKTLLIASKTPIFLGSSNCSCMCPFKKYETEAEIGKKFENKNSSIK